MNIVVFEGLSFSEQVRKMIDTDILLGVTGSGFANSLFLLPHSAAVPIMALFNKQTFFMRLCQQSQIFYMPIFNFDAPDYPESCDTIEYDHDEEYKNTTCSTFVKQQYYGRDVSGNKHHVLSAIEVAWNYVLTYKYHHIDVNPF